MASKRGIEAGRAYVRASLDDSLFRKGLGRMKSGLASFGRALPAIASSIYIFQKLGSVVSSAASRIVSSLEDIAAIDKAGKAFGATSEQVTGLFGVFKASGATNARENIESLVTLSGRIKDVMSGTGKESKKLFDGLNVSAEELSKLPIDEQFFRLHEAIMQLPDPMDRVNRLMLAFGEDGGKTLIGTLSKSTPELRELASSMALTSEETAAATKAQKAMAAVSAKIEFVWNKIAVAIAPFIVQAVGAFEKGLQAVRDWVKESQSLQWVLNAIKTVFAAMGAGQWAQAWNVVMAALKANFIAWGEVLRHVWINVGSSLVMAFVNAGAMIETIWVKLSSRLVSLILEAVQKSLSLTEQLAKSLGLDALGKKAGTYSFAAGKFGQFATSQGSKQVREIESRRGQTLKTIEEDAERRRQQESKYPAALAELNKALDAAREATELNTEKIAAPELPEQAATKMAARADTAINTAAAVNSSAGADAFVRAVTGIRSSEQLQQDMLKAEQEAVKHLKKIAAHPIVLSPARTA